MFTLTCHLHKNHFTYFLKLCNVISQEEVTRLVSMSSRKHPVTALLFKLQVDQDHSDVLEREKGFWVLTVVTVVIAKDSICLVTRQLVEKKLEHCRYAVQT